MAAASCVGASEARQLPAPLALSLMGIADVMAGARDEWWVIGSAAMAFHGAPVDAADIDILASVEDAERLFPGKLAPGIPSSLFRSARFGRWQDGASTIEIMAGLEVRRPAGWQAVEVPARVPVRLRGRLLFTPGIAGLLALCRQFDRDKDRVRARLLEDRLRRPRSRLANLVTQEDC